MVRQAGFFDVEERLRELSAKGDHLERITAPVLLVAGDGDGVAPPELNRRNVARIDRATFVEVPECGHILPWERPEALLQAVRSFVLENVRMHA